MPTQTVAPFDFSVQSGERAAREALSLFFEAVAPLNLDVEEKGTVELVLAEVLNNIVEHAYPNPDTQGPITVVCEHHENGLHIAVKDQGLAMPNEQMPLGILPSAEVELDDMPEGGFGWFLIQHLAKDMNYKRIESGNQFNMRIAVATGQ
ncbi:MAG: ATP-binding protein [Roseobacter sp.]